MVQLAVVAPNLLHPLLGDLAAQVILDLLYRHLRLQEEVQGHVGQVARLRQHAVVKGNRTLR